jgi:putative serine protease PepD
MRTLTRRAVATVSAAALAGAAAGAGVSSAIQSDQPASTTTTQMVAAPPTANASNTSGATTISDVYKQAKQGVVEITVTQQNGKAVGSGFVTDKQGDIVTNDHVVSGGGSIEVAFADGTKATAHVVGADPSSDIAVIRVSGVDSSKLQPLSFADSSKAQVGDGVVAIGSPFGLEGSLTVGVISALGRSIDAPNHYTISGAIQTDAAINHGNSGGPLLNSSGDVIGVNAQIDSGSGDNSGVGFAIASNTVRSVAQQLASGQSVKHPYLGVKMQDAESGATVAAITAGSPAAGSSLSKGDVITAIDGRAVASSTDAVAAIGAHRPGDDVTLTVRHGSGAHAVRVTLGSR